MTLFGRLAATSVDDEPSTDVCELEESVKKVIKNVIQFDQ